MTNQLDCSFSVLISVYKNDNPQFFKLSLDSIFSQTLKPNEIIIVKDGPLSPALEAVIQFFIKRQLIEVIEIGLEKNVGLGKALNIGLDSCRCNLVARMDADDICTIDRFEEQIRFLIANSDISVIGSQVEEFNFTPGDLKRYRLLPHEYGGILKFSKYRNPINHPTVIFRKDHVVLAGSYKDMALFEDYFLWARMISMGFKIRNVDKVLLNFRVGNDMVGRRHGLAYLKKEIHFLRTIKKTGFITNKNYIISLVTKVPLRLMPKFALKAIYKIFLR